MIVGQFFIIFSESCDQMDLFILKEGISRSLSFNFQRGAENGSNAIRFSSMQLLLSPCLLATLVSALKFVLDQHVQVGIDPSIISLIVFFSF